MRTGRMTPDLTVDILDFPHHAPTERLHAHETAMPLDIRVWFFLQPAQRIRSAREVGEGRVHVRTLAKFFVEPFPESAKRERIAEDQDIHAFVRRRSRRLRE